MAQDCYALDEGRLVLHDIDLEICLEDVFTPTRIDLENPRKTRVAEGEVLVVREGDQRELQMVYVQKEGKQHGQMCYFYPGGQLQGFSFYKEGQLHGPSSFYSKEGTKLSMSWFFQGRYQGKLRQYFKNEEISSLQRYKDGVYQGDQEYFYENGAVKSLMPYDKGRLHGKVVLFFAGGGLKRETFFQHGLKEGWDRLWNEKGVLVDAGEFHKGNPVGKHHRWHDNGCLHEEVIYYTPKRFDKRSWNSEQTLVYEGVYDSSLNFTQKMLTETGHYHIQKGRWDDHKLVLDQGVLDNA